ncbi:MAG: hypothetical protein WCO84_06735 [bacterium]
MRTNAATAQKAQDVTPTMTILEPTATEKTAKVIQFKASAQEAKSEPITQEATAETTAQQTIALETEEAETVSIYDVIAKVNAEYISGERILPSEAARRAEEETAATSAEEVTPTATIIKPTPAAIIEAKPVQSIEDIKRKSEVLSRLAVKWDNLAEKRRRVENFAISHDGDTASAIIRDAQGEVFESNSPKTIGKLIEFWKTEFSEAIAAVEAEMREIA